MHSSKRVGRKDKAISNHVWEVRHAGLLGIKYEVAVRSDVFEEAAARAETGETATSIVKDESGDVEMKDLAPSNARLSGGKQILQDVVDSAVLGYVISSFSCHIY